VGRNVAASVRPPAGHEGRPSKALSVEQAQQLLRAAAGESRRQPACAPGLRGLGDPAWKEISTPSASVLRCSSTRAGCSASLYGQGRHCRALAASVRLHTPL